MQKPIRAPIRTLVMTVVLLVGPAAAYAQSSPIPTSRVPGFTASDPRPGMSGGSPASSGSNTGSNVGAGATASPLNNDVAAPGAPPPETARATGPSLFGASRELPLTKPAR